ncbi:hypothetical protein KR222_002858 [Zaprionus bogoriensis]|nr:hypothetical protein KR222_002858 [Zaprionus bogoriensis]
MRLDFQIMWFIIILSLCSQITIATRCRRLPRRQIRTKRLYFSDEGDSGDSHRQECDDMDHKSGSGSSSSSSSSSSGNSKYADAKSRSSGLAAKAAQEAKQANEEMASAVKQAADRIKLEYAEKAASAARAAVAVLEGKQQVLSQLEVEVREAELVVQEESQELTASEANSQLALKAHQQAQDELKMLMDSLKLARENAGSAEMVSAACKQSMADKALLLESAQKRVNLLLQQLSEARIEHAKTKKAAYRAMCAANEAKQRIQQTGSR